MGRVSLDISQLEETPLSDVDLAYLLEKGLASLEEEEIDKEIYLGLGGFLGTDEITLMNLEKAPFPIAFSVLREGKVLFCRQPKRLADFKGRILALCPELNRIKAEVLNEFKMRWKETAIDIDSEKILYYIYILAEESVSLNHLWGKSTNLSPGDSYSCSELRRIAK